MKRQKKGFTVVELVIVIAVIAVLAAVLIPTFSSLIKKANVSNDTVLVKNLNTALAATAAVDGAPETMHEALEMVAENGFTVEKLTPRSTGDILWDQEANRFALVESGKYVFGEGKSAGADVEKKWALWKVIKSGELSSDYSNYLAEGYAGTTLDVVTGVDVGNNNNITQINYTNSATQDVIINTKNKDSVVTINGANSTVKVYGTANVVNAEVVDENSLYIKGMVSKVLIGEGRVVFESEAETSVVIPTNVKAIVAFAQDLPEEKYPFVQRQAGVNTFKVQTTTAEGTKATEAEVTYADDSTETPTVTGATTAIVGALSTPPISVEDARGVAAGTSNEGLTNKTKNVIVNLEQLKYAVGEGGEYKLGDSFDVTEPVNVSKNFKLELNGYTITTKITTGGRTFHIYNGCNSFEIDGTVEGSKMTVGEENAVQNKTYGYVDVKEGNCNLVLNGGEYYHKSTNSGGSSVIRVRNNAAPTVTLNNCKMEVEGYQMGFINGGLELETNVKATLNVIGGEYDYQTSKSGNGPFELTFIKARFENVKVTTADGPIVEHFGKENSSLVFVNCDFKNPTEGTWDAAAIASSNGRVLSIESGSYSGKFAAYTYNTGGTINISGGTFVGNDAVLKADGGTEYEAHINVVGGKFNGKIIASGGTKKAEINISGGTFTNVSFEKTGTASIVIKGGTFDADPTSYLAEGYTATENNGVWTVAAAN